MSFGPTSPLTGGPQTGFTSPTYTLVSDVAPNAHSEQYAVSAIGGTQTGVNVHSVSQPFTLTMERPAQFKQVGTPNPVTGIVSRVGRNVFVVRVRKGVLPLAGQPYQTLLAEAKISVPAGSDSADSAQVRAALSALIGALWDGSAGIGDSLIDGVL